MTAAIFIGLALAAGILIVLRGVFAPAPKLSTLADGTFRANSTLLAGQQGLLEVARVRLLLWLPTDTMLAGDIEPDLAITRTTRESLILQKLMTGVGAMVLPYFVWAFGTITELMTFNVLWALVAGFALAAGGFVFPTIAVRSQANERREEFLAAFAAYLNLARILVGASDGPESALERAAAQGEGWAFNDLRAALEVARTDPSLRPWDSIGRLGETFNIREVREFGATMNASATSSSLSSTLKARAENLHEKVMVSIQKDSESKTEQMDYPLTIMTTAFTIFLMYAAMFQSSGDFVATM